MCTHRVSAENKVQNSEAGHNFLIIANKSFLAFSKYGGKPLKALRNLNPSLIIIIIIIIIFYLQLSL